MQPIGRHVIDYPYQRPGAGPGSTAGVARPGSVSWGKNKAGLNQCVSEETREEPFGRGGNGTDTDPMLAELGASSIMSPCQIPLYPRGNRCVQKNPQHTRLPPCMSKARWRIQRNEWKSSADFGKVICHASRTTSPDHCVGSARLTSKPKPRKSIRGGCDEKLGGHDAPTIIQDKYYSCD